MEREGEREQRSAGSGMNFEPEAKARGIHPYWDSCYSSHFPLPQWSFVSASPDTDTGFQYQVSLQILKRVNNTWTIFRCMDAENHV